MPNPATFRDIISGNRRGAFASCARGVFSLIELPYTWAVQHRNKRFETAPSLTTRVDVPVVSVGNITMGGTGKTPLVAWLADWAKEHGRRPALVSRGYGSRDGESNDEARELAVRLPDVPHEQNPKRVEAARRVLEETGADLIIADDAFQHRYLARDLDIVLLDALEPFGFGRVFPRGTLREPMEGLARADVVLLSRADLVDEQRREAIRRRALEFAPNAAWGMIAHAASHWANYAGERQPLEAMSGKRVVAFCGLGNPAGFRATLGKQGLDVATFEEFPDHHAYREDDIHRLDALASQHGADAIVCTMKDLVKVECERIGDVPLLALGITIDWLDGQAAFEQILCERLLAR